MLGPGDVISAIDSIELGLLDRQWIDDVWREKFESCPDDLPDEFGERFSILSHHDLVRLMKYTVQIIDKWLSDTSSLDKDSSNTASWASLSEIDFRGLLALIFFYVKKFQTNNQSMPHIELGIEAGKLYFSLLKIPGSSVYNIFQIPLFEACMEMFFIYKLLFKSQETVVRKKKGKNNQDNVEEFMDVELDFSSQKAVLTMLVSLLAFLQDLIDCFSFKNHSEAMRIVMTVMAELTRTERQASVDFFVRCKDANSFVLLAREAYLTLFKFCTNLHGRITETVRLILFRIMPNLSLIGGSAIPEMVKWPQKDLTVVRNLALWFISTYIIPLGACAHGPLKILIQHLCRSMIDRADYRSKATDMVISIISLLPEAPYYAVLKWLFREPLTHGAGQRVVALELLSKLIYLKQGTTEQSKMAEGSQLNSEDRSQSQIEPSASQSAVETSQGETSQSSGTDMGESVTSSRVVSFCKPITFVPIQYRRAMLLMIIDRLRDESATVRAKALIFLSEIIANRKSPTVLALVKSIFIVPYENLEEIDITTEEQDFVPWKTFVSKLEKIEDPDTCKMLMPGARRIVSGVVKKCQDLRVSVRKAALTFLLEIFKLSPKWISEATLEIFGQHCRDFAMSIRKEMITHITDLMLLYPANKHLNTLWIEEVMPRIKDREIRVQEHALEILTRSILYNIKTLENTVSETDQLPWNLLTSIAEHKMRCFLVEACLLWRVKRVIESNSKQVLASLTHIGSANNSAVWVLLSSLSEFIDIPQPEKVLDHYLREVAVAGESNHEISNLVLTTLKNCCHKLKKERQMELRTSLLCDLNCASLRPYLVKFAVEIVTSLMVILDGNKTSREEVDNWAVQKTLICEKHLESCLPSNCSYCDNCVFYITLLGELTDFHPRDDFSDKFDLLYNFLMTPNKRCRKLSQIKAALIITLGRFAIRNGYIASRLVSGLSEILSTNKDPVLLNNAVVAVADIGSRFPNLVEPLIPSLSLCLKNEHQSVREITLVILIDLLQEEYLKARGAVVFHLITLIVDPSPRTSSIIKYYLSSSFLPKYPETVEQMVVVCLFHFNKYYTCPQYTRLAMTDAEGKAFDISGHKRHQDRMCIYKFLLKSFNDFGRLRTFNSICSSVLNGAAERIISFTNPNGEQVLRDAFHVLLCDDMKFNEGSKKKGEEDEEPSEEKQSKALKEHVFETLRKKTIMEETIPICSKLRKVLNKHKLRTLLYRFVRELLREFTAEFPTIFRDDKQFGQEILYEIEHMQPGQVDVEESYDDPVEANQNPEVIAAEIHETIKASSSRKSLGSNKSNIETSPKNSETDADKGNQQEGTPDNVGEVGELIQNIEISTTQAAKADSERNDVNSEEEEVPLAHLTNTQQSGNETEFNNLESLNLRSFETKGSRKSRSSRINKEMPPPSTRASRNSSRRSTPVTPGVAQSKPKLISSTPLAAPSIYFEESGISPVNQSTQSETGSESKRNRKF